ALQVDEPEVAVRAPGLALRRLAADDQLSVCREAQIVAAAKTEAGPLRVQGSRVPRQAPGCRHHEDVRALALLPLGPVPREQVIDEARVHVAALRLLCPLLVACIVAAALRIHLAGEGDESSVGRE